MKQFTTILLVFLTTLIHAQEKKQQNLPDYEQKWLHFGFTIGTNVMNFNIDRADNFFNQDEFNQIYAIESTSHTGFHLGPVTNVHLGEYFDFRLLVNLSFTQRDLSYLVVEDTLATNPELSKHTMKISSTYLEFPMLIKYKAMRLNNYRPYLIAGINPKIDLAAQKKIKEDEMPKIRLKNLDVAWEIGAGIDFYLPYFKFSTEIKYSVGVLNMAEPDDTQFTSSMKNMRSKAWMISFHFE